MTEHPSKPGIPPIPTCNHSNQSQPPSLQPTGLQASDTAVWDWSNLSLGPTTPVPQDLPGPPRPTTFRLQACSLQYSKLRILQSAAYSTPSFGYCSLGLEQCFFRAHDSRAKRRISMPQADKHPGTAYSTPSFGYCSLELEQSFFRAHDSRAKRRHRMPQPATG